MMYERLAAFLLENLVFDDVSVVLEAGCGSGSLTIPFVKKIMKIKKNFEYVALDLSAGPYAGSLNTLKAKIVKGKHDKIVVTAQGDVRDMKDMADESVDLIVSNELLCELDREGLERAFKEFYRVLRRNGQTAHGELSPIPENKAQRLLLEADAYSLETLKPKPEWFSPSADEVASLLHKTGFKDITVKYFETNVKMSYKEAVNYLKGWVSDDFIKTYEHDLRRYGLEFPMEHVIFCKK
jgi:ubiquinone/menaquinone biosynthesis C-methylase UbiE